MGRPTEVEVLLGKEEGHDLGLLFVDSEVEEVLQLVLQNRMVSWKTL